MLIITFVSPQGKVGTSYEHVVKLTGTGPFSLGEYFLPENWSANVVGSTLTFGGMSTEAETGMVVSFEIFSCCDCDPVTLTSTIVITRACSYSWSMVPSIAPVGTPIKTTFTPPSFCPADTVLMLALFEADGTTPLIIPAISSLPLEISVNRGTSTYVVPRSESGQHIVFKPSLTQSACLATCTPSNTVQRRIVPIAAPCTVTWDFQPRASTAGVPQPITYIASGPTGGRLKIVFYEGNVPVVGVNPLYLSFGTPVTFTNTWPAGTIGLDYNWRPATTLDQDLDIQSCTIQPARIDLDIVGSSCVTSWAISRTVFNALTLATQTFSATGIPAGCRLQLGIFFGAALTPDATIVLTPDVPSITYPQSWAEIAVGGDWNVRPLLVQDACLVCSVQPPRADFDVVSSTCGVLFNVTNPVITAVGQSHVITVAGPAGATVNLNIKGRANGSDYDSNIPVTLPGLFPYTTTASAAGDISNLTFTLTGIGGSAGLVVCGGPFNTSANVPAGPALPCDVLFNVTNPVITAAGQSHVITATGAAGTTVNLRINGRANGATYDSNIPVTLPGIFPYTTTASAAGDISNLTFTLTGIGASSLAKICGGPFTTSANVVSGSAAPSLGACLGGSVCGANSVTAVAGHWDAPGSLTAWPVAFTNTVGSSNQYWRINSANLKSGAGGDVTKCMYSIPFSVSAGASTFGGFVTQAAVANYFGQTLLRASISKKSCDFSSPGCVFLADGGLESYQPSFLFSLNNPGQAGAQFNLTTGSYYLNIEFCSHLAALNVLAGGYNANVGADFSFLA